MRTIFIHYSDCVTDMVKHYIQWSLDYYTPLVHKPEAALERVPWAPVNP